MVITIILILIGRDFLIDKKISRLQSEATTLHAHIKSSKRDDMLQIILNELINSFERKEKC